MRLLWPLLALVSTSAFAQPDAGMLPPMRVQSRANPDKAQLGEPFTIELVVTHLPSQRYELAVPGDLGDFDYRGVLRERADAADSSTTTLRVQMAGFALGKKRTPALTLNVSQDGQTSSFEVQGLEVEIVNSLPADADKKGEALYDIRKPEEVAVRTWRVLYALAALLIAGLLAWAVTKYLRRPKPISTEPEKPKEPLHVRTIAALDALAAQNLPGQGRVKEFYFRLSEIIRGYLGELYSFDALECTSSELLEALRKRHTPGLPMEEVTSFANVSDFARYAKSEPTADECKSSLELGYRIVHHTTAAALPTRPAPASGANGPQ